jgi:hypothetical protein
MLAPHRRRVRRSVAQRFAKALLHTYWNAAEPDGADASSPATLSPKLKVVPAKFSEALLCSVDPLTLMKYLAPFSPAPALPTTVDRMTHIRVPVVTGEPGHPTPSPALCVLSLSLIVRPPNGNMALGTLIPDPALPIVSTWLRTRECQWHP